MVSTWSDSRRPFDDSTNLVTHPVHFPRAASGDHLQPDRRASASAGDWLWLFGQKC